MKNEKLRKLELDLLENGLDFILSSVDLIANIKNVNQIKYSLVHLSSGFELVLKQKLAQQHWTLLFEDVKNANRKDYESGNFQSVNFESLLKRLENISNIKLPTKHIIHLKELRKRRNRIEHFHCKELENAAISLISKVLSIVLDFIKDHFDINSFSEYAKKQIYLLRTKIKLFNKLKTLRLTQIKEKLEEVKLNHHLINCPLCIQETLILSEDLYCEFCGHSNEPEKLALEYLETINNNLPKADKHVLDFCPHCKSQSFIREKTKELCFNCFEIVRIKNRSI
jgi:hypothetical protein